jgi:hypothetical protein
LKFPLSLSEVLVDPGLDIHHQVDQIIDDFVLKKKINLSFFTLKIRTATEEEALVG